MSRSGSHDTMFGPDHLATLRQAYDDACQAFGLNPSPADLADHRYLRDMIAAAILTASKIGERDPGMLSAFAVAFSMRNWRVPSE